MLDIPVLQTFGTEAVGDGKVLFSSVSGSHLYGFPSVDSDVDLRGAFVAPLRSVLSLNAHKETLERADTVDGVLIESVFHEVEKYFRLLLKGNGYIIEQIMSPLAVVRTQEYDTLARLAPRFLTKRAVLGHYSGFSADQLSLIRRHPHKEIKLILYSFRVLMTGLTILRTGRVESNILVLNESFKFPFVDELVAMKHEREHGSLEPGKRTVDWYIAKAEESRALLESEAARSSLPETPDPDAVRELDDLLYSLRTSGSH